MSGERAAKRPKSVGRTVFDVLSGFGLATILLLLTALLTWLATLEQIDHGLHATLNKYFHWQSWYLIPDLPFQFDGWWIIPAMEGSWPIPPLPGGFWVCALLLLNMILGGVVRAQKGWKHSGNLIAHFGIIFMLVAGGVAHLFEERGNMAVHEGESSNAAEDYFEYVVEVLELDGEGRTLQVHVVRGDDLRDLEGGRSRVFDLPGLPFDLEVAGFLKHAQPVHVHEAAPRREELVVDEYYLMEREGEVEAERNVAGCYGRLVAEDGSKSDPFIMSGFAFHPHTIEIDGRWYGFNMRKRLWTMPFTLRLNEFTAEFHPGTSRPAKFVSQVTRIEGGSEAEVTIQMNEPMRYEGLTFFQASYGPAGAGPGENMYSVFEVVSNPADKWPEYSLYIVTFGMLVTFVTKLVFYLQGQSRKKS